MSEKLRAGVIGVGVVGRAHVQGYAACKDAEVVAIADINEEALQAAQREFGIPHAFTDYRDLLALEEVDVVSVCTPPFNHCESTVAAAQAGKHVLCEKPMSMNAAEAQRMVEEARRANVKLGIASGGVRLGPAAQAAKRLIDSGALGTIYYVRVSSYRRRGRPGLDILVNSKWFLDSRKAGGGALADIACYDMDLVLYLLGSPEPLRVSAMTFRGIGDPVAGDFVFDVEEHGSVFVRFANGTVATFEHSWAANMDGGDGLRLFGSRGGLKFQPFTFYTHQAGLPLDATIPLPQARDGRKVVIEDFLHACRTDGQPATPGEDGWKVMRIIDAAYRSAREGREVEA